jgi:hypothetical protein
MKAVNNINGMTANNRGLYLLLRRGTGTTAWMNGVDDVDGRRTEVLLLPSLSSSSSFTFFFLLPPPLY